MKQHNSVGPFLILLLTLGFSSGFAEKASAQGRLLTFDDLPELSIEPIPNGYAGIQWDNFYLQGGGGYELLDFEVIKLGYIYGIVSPKNVAFNAYGQPSEISSLTPFFIHSGYFTAAYRDGLQLRVQGYLGDTPVYDSTYTLDMTVPTLLNFDYPAIDRIRFTSSGGVPHYSFAFGDQFVMDNLSISVIPEPSASALIIASLAALALVQWMPSGFRSIGHGRLKV